MKKWFTKVLAFVLAVALAWVPVGEMGNVQAASEDAVNIPDDALRSYLYDKLNKAEGDVITEGDLAGLGYIYIVGSMHPVTDLTGLEYCTNLTQFHVSGLEGLDWSIVSGFTKLEELGLTNVGLTAVPDCSALTNLKYVTLSSNSTLTDISGLANCNSLVDVNLRDCTSLKDISPLKNKTNLTTLDLEKVYIDESNQTSYMETIASLTNLTSAYFCYDEIKDEHLSMFAPLTNLEYLNLGYCNISNVDWLLSHKDKLKHLTLYGNGSSLVDGDVLGQLTNLSILGVSGTGITDFSFISKLPYLTSSSSRWSDQWAPTSTHTYIFRAIDNGGTISIPNFIKDDKGNLVAPVASEYYTYNAATGEIIVPSSSIRPTWGDMQENPIFTFEATTNTGDVVQVKSTIHVNLLMINSEFEDVELEVGDSKQLTVSTSSNMLYNTPAKTYRWYKDGVLIEGANSSSLNLTDVQLTDAGEYTAEVLWVFEDGSNETVSTSKSLTVTVTNPIVPLAITTQPEDTGIIEGKSGSLTVVAEGEGDLTYQWYKGDEAISGATSATLNITNMAASDVGTYKVVVSDSLGTLTSNAVSVTMQKELKITKQPVGITLIEGESGSLSVTAEGHGTLGYRWYVDDVMLGSEVSSTLNLENVEVTDGGIYYVIVSDSNGSLTSNKVTVVVQSALKILTQPTAVAKVEGSAASLTVTAAGEGDLSYQWYKDDTKLDGETGATLSFNSLSMSDEGSYKVVVTDKNGTLSSASVSVTVYNKLEITTQPTGFKVVEGNNGSLTVAAEGEGALTYQWYKDGVAIEGATSSTLTLTKMEAANAGSYTVKITDSVGSTIISNAATVTVHNALEITQQPVGISLLEGNAASLTVAAEGQGTLSYQWYKDDVALSGETSATLSFSSLAMSNAGKYKVEVSDINGTVTSTTVAVVVYNKLEITQQPTGFTVVEGTAKTLAVEAEGEGTLFYQWYKDGVALTGKTSAALAFSSITLSDAGEYKVMITDDIGNVTSNTVTVAVHNKLEITKQPTGFTKTEGEAGSLTAEAEGEGTLSYQWYKDNTKLDGKTESTLSFETLAIADAGSYTVVVSDLNGTVTSTAVKVVVYNKLEITKQPAGFTMVEGNQASLAVEADGEGTLTYQWYKDDEKLDGETKANVSFAGLALSDAGEYKVVVTDSTGSSVSSDAVTVAVHNKLEIITQPEGINLIEGKAGSLTVRAEGEGTLSYQWYKDETKLDGATTTALSFDSITMADAGSYTVKVSDQNGTVTSNAVTVVVYDQLAITKQPTGITLIEGNTGSLTVEAEGEGTLKYQWYKDDAALNGETKASLSFSSIAKADAGNYKVTVSDLNGSVTSTPVIVTVQTALKITTQPAGLSLLVGESGTLTVAAVGEGTLSYQWYKGDTEIAGATAASLALKNVAEADEAAYKVKITDQNGSIVSNAANVVVDKNLKITKQPVALDVLVGSTASLTVEAEGEGTLTYQWYKDDTAIAGATNTALSWENISLSDAGTYKVVVTDQNGSVNSNEVVIAVDKRLAITKQPVGITLVEGNTESLTVEAEGAGTLKYQWYKDDVAVAGANKASFVLNAAEMADAGTYKVEVSDDNGKVTSIAVTVTVQNALEITKQPVGIQLIEGGTGSLTVEAEGEGELSYQWYKDGVAVESATEAYALNGAGSATLELTKVVLSDAGTYKVVITDNNGSIASEEVVVVVEKRLVITSQPVSLTLIEGGAGSLTIEAVGAGELSYQWYKDNVVIEGAAKATYMLNDVQLADAGEYKVVVTDKNSNVTSNVMKVNVEKALKIVKQPEGLTLTEGESGTLQILATGEGTLKYQWFRDGVVIQGATNSSLNLANLNLTDAGEYKVVVSDDNTSLFSNAVKVVVEAVVVVEDKHEEPVQEPAQTPAPVAIAPKTGEENTPVLVMLMAFLALAGVAFMRKKNRKL